MKALFILLAVLVAVTNAQNPVLYGWKQTSATGYSSIKANVLSVKYDTTYVYINANSIPAYTIGPTWGADTYIPSAQNNTWRFKLSPSANTGTLTAAFTVAGAVGVFIDGVKLENAWDAQTYNSLNVWYRNAYFWEGSSFDSCYGHPQQDGSYHIHVNPKCLYNYSSSAHSPLIGYMFDSYPVYGAYAYSSANNSCSSIKLMTSSYQLRSITDRSTLSNGTTLSSTYQGPPINSTYPLGAFIQDYVYTAGTGDLDANNGRWCVTPEYPSGTYAYFVTIYSNGTPSFPFILGAYFYGVVDQNNFATTSTTVPSGVSTYNTTVTASTTTCGSVRQSTSSTTLTFAMASAITMLALFYTF